METQKTTPGLYDDQRYAQLWQRVAPSIAPYPEPAAGERQTQLPWNTAETSAQRAEEQLPGAEANPCCMGSAAKESLEVLEGFIEEELADFRYYCAFSRCAPGAAGPVLHRIAQEKERHARRLMAVYYLITGRCYQYSLSFDRIYIGSYCPALRERYHTEACGGWNYARAADGTTDICLQEIFNELSRETYRCAETVTRLLEQALTKACSSRGSGV